MSRCGVFVEGGPPVPVLSGAGLYVEDPDHNAVFLMSRAEVALDTDATTDYESVLLDAAYTAEGVVKNYQDGGGRLTTCSLQAN